MRRWQATQGWLGTKKGTVKRVVLCIALTGLGLGLSPFVRAHPTQGLAPAPQTYMGLEISVASLEHASSAALSDCPPRKNTVRAMSKPGEGFAIVTVNVKVLQNYEPAPLKRPVLTDSTSQTYNTAASFVDLWKAPESSCAFPFRIPDGTALKSIQTDALSFDLTSFDAQPR